MVSTEGPMQEFLNSLLRSQSWSC